MAVAETARLVASIELKDNLSKGVASATKSVDKLDSRLSRIGGHARRGLGEAARNLQTIGIGATAIAVAGLTKSVQAASDLEQSIGAVNSVYGDSADIITAWGRTSAESAGLSQRAVNEMASVTGAQLQSMGFNAEQAAEASVTLQKRGADLAATFGGDTSDALVAISALLRGERDPIERYGVSLKQADITARVLAKGLDTTTTAAKKKSEAIAALELFLEQTAKTEGQFARETDSLAGQQQKLRANLENTGATIGRALLPQLSKLVGRFNEFVVGNEPAIQRLAAALPPLFDKLLATAERLPWGAIGDSLQLAGAGAQLVLDAFLSLPPWVQTAVITGWGLNKLTGGALGDIVGELGKGLIKGVLGINAGVVNINAATVNGGGGLPGAAGKVGGIGLLGGAALAGLGAALGAAVVAVANKTAENSRTQAAGVAETQRVYLTQSPSLSELQNSLAAVDAGIDQLPKDPIGGLIHQDAINTLRGMRSDLVAAIDAQTALLAQRKAEQGTQQAINNAALADQRKGEQTLGGLAAVETAVASGLAAHRAGERGDLKAIQTTTSTSSRAAASLITGTVNVTTGAVRSGTSIVSGAIHSLGSAIRSLPPPIVNVSITAGAVQKSETTQNRSGPASGSRQHGHPGSQPV